MQNAKQNIEYAKCKKKNLKKTKQIIKQIQYKIYKIKRSKRSNKNTKLLLYHIGVQKLIVQPYLLF